MSEVEVGTSLVSVAAAADQCGVSQSTVRKWVERYGLRRVTWDGRQWLVEDEVLECDRARRHAQARAAERLRDDLVDSARKVLEEGER